MKRVLGVLLLLALLGPASAQTLGVGYTTVPSQPQAGQEFILNVVVTNSGTAAASGVEVGVSTFDLGLEVLRQSTVRIGDLAAGSAAAPFKFRAAAPGLYEVRVSVAYGAGGATPSGVNTRFYVQVYQTSNFLLRDVTYDRSPEPGASFRATLRLLKLGQGARDVFVEPQTKGVSSGAQPQQVSAIGTNKAYLATWAAGEEKAVAFDLFVESGTAPGVLVLPVAIRYLDNVAQSQAENLSVGIDVRSRPRIAITKVESDPAELKAGTTFAKLILKVDNSGAADAKFLKMTLRPELPFELSRSYRQVADLGLLKSGSGTTATFFVDVKPGARAGGYLLPLEIGYQDTTGREFSENATVEVVLKEKPDFAVVGTRSVPDNLSPGSKAQLRVQIQNTGNEKAESVSLRAVGEAELPFVFTSKSDLVGALRPGETGEAALALEVKGSAAPKAYNLDVEIRATGDRDISDTNVYVVSRTVAIAVAEGSGPGAGPLAGGLVLLGVAYIAYRNRHKLRARLGRP